MSDYDKRDLQLCELKIMKEIDRICKKNGIIYYLAYGTLLGAVRHKGFIPWDDDVDLFMDLKSYRKFCKVCKKDLGSDYFLQTSFLLQFHQNFQHLVSTLYFNQWRLSNRTRCGKSRMRN